MQKTYIETSVFLGNTGFAGNPNGEKTVRGHGSGTFLEELFGLEGKGAVVIAGTDVLCGSWRGGSGDRGAGLFWSGGIAERPARTFGGGEVLLMRHVAREWTVHGIRVNALCPDFFPAENNRRVLDESRVKATMDHTPTNRFGEAEELIGATLLLASEKAGSFITGSNLVVNGVFPLRPSRSDWRTRCES